ncbi:Protein F20D6.2 [Aphelenchoides avenae]|nr:Protein F20D6.2 [Aphelenchus avenae]
MAQQWRDLNGTDKWQRMGRTYNNVWKNYFDHLKPFAFISDGEEHKYFVDFIDPSAECNVITMGLGGTVDGEKELFARYPQCRFLGVDPSADDNKHLVEGLNSGLEIKRATFLQTAVAAESGQRKASLKTAGGSYADNVTDHMAFVDLLKEHNQGRLVDLLMLDVEGAEYGILPLLTGKPGLFMHHPPTMAKRDPGIDISILERAEDLPIICQINMEFHTPLESYGYSLDEFYAHFTSMLQDGRHMPMHIEINGPLMFLRVFMLNIKDPECVDKFIC